MLAFGVTVGVGLAPLLGKIDVPLFSPLLKMLPDSEQARLITTSTAGMALVAIIVHWFATDTPLPTLWRRLIFVTLASLTFALYFQFVDTSDAVAVQIPFGGSNDRATRTFLVGFNFPNKPPCEGLSRADCISRRLSFDEREIATYWGDPEIARARRALTRSYLFFMIVFGLLVGLVSLPYPVGEGTHRARPRAPRRRRPSKGK